MRKLLRGLARPSTFAPVVALTTLVFFLSLKIIPQNTLAILINGLFIAVSIMIFAAYGPPLVASLRADKPEKDQYLLSGILLLWAAIAMSRMWSLALIMAGKPPWMINHWFQTLCYLVAASSGFFFLQIAGKSKIGMKYTVAAAIIAVTIGTIMLAFFEV